MVNEEFGDTEECLARLSARYKQAQFRQIMATFCGVGERTVDRWVAGGPLPMGEGKLKLQVFLFTCGYKLDELINLPRVLRELAEVIGFSVLSTEEVIIRLGYKNTQDIHRILRGEVNPSRDRHIAINKLLDDTSKQVKLSKTRLKVGLEEALGIDLSGSGQSNHAPAPAEVSIEATVVNINEAEVVDHLISALSAALDNGNQKGRGRGTSPKALPERRRKAIAERVDESRRTRLIAQIGMLT
jgi:hypothetical protein